MEITPRIANRNFFIYIGIIVLLFGVFLLWFFYFRLDESKLKKLETKLQNDKEITKYISTISIVKDDTGKVIEGKDIKIYPYTLGGFYKKSFNSLSESEKQDVLKKVVEKIEENNGTKLVSCGYKKDCSIDNIRVFDSNSDKADNYTYDTYYEETKHSYEDQDGSYQTETLSDSNSTTNNSDYTTSTDNYTPDLEIVDKNGRVDGDYVYVTGAVKNNSNSSYTFIQIKVTYFEENGNILDTDNTYLNSSDPLLPNEQKSFEVMTHMVSQGFKNYKVSIMDYNIE